MTTTVLGAIIAGGAARRFGSDKGAALVDGTTLIDHVAAALRPQVDALVIVGRAWPGLPQVADRPAPGLGPLAGLCGALDYARANRFSHVLTAGCDTLPIPPDLRARLTPGPAVIASHWLFGLWPTHCADPLDAHIARGGSRALRGWVEVSGATEVAAPHDFYNLNTPADLAAFIAR